MTIQRRPITARGITPVGVMQHDYAHSWVYGTVAPRTGASFFLIVPKLNAAHMQVFLDEFSRAHAATFNSLLLDNSAAHTAKKVRLPGNVTFVLLPPYSPERTPMERVWEDVRARLAWQHVRDVDDLEDRLCKHLTAYDPTTLQALTSYPYLRPALHAGCS